MASTSVTDRPLATVDVVIFGVVAERLSVLLVQRPTRRDEPFPGRWALPGGFVDVATDATIEACALRKLREKTNVRSPYLEQLGSWGGASRDPRGWSVTTVYFSLIDANAVRLATGGNAEAVEWRAIEGEGVREKLAFDHATLLTAAVRRLRAKVEYTSLPAFLLPASFTLRELQSIYELVLGRSLDKSAFRTRMLSADFVESTGERRTGANRPAEVYRLKDREAVFFSRTFRASEP
jgi:8-oxo-dGTP diphosphatase